MLTIWVCNFLAKGFGAKVAHKMLVKLTPGDSVIKLFFFAAAASEKKS
jgi:hypothetical protein